MQEQHRADRGRGCRLAKSVFKYGEGEIIQGHRRLGKDLHKGM